LVYASTLAYLRAIPETTRRTHYFGRDFDYPSRSIIGFIERGDEWDGLVLRQILPVLPQDAVVVEVGSNIGASTIVIAELLKRAVFLLIEAGDRYLPYLRTNTTFLGGPRARDRDPRDVRRICGRSGVQHQFHHPARHRTWTTRRTSRRAPS
jgi:hypothetical protein